MNITHENSPNHWDGRRGWKPDMIVCHITDGSYSGAVSWLCNPQSQASAHFVVARDGRVTQLVDIRNGAWCNGTSVTAGHAYHYSTSTLPLVRSRGTNANRYTISIEHEGMYSQTHGALTDAQEANDGDSAGFTISSPTRVSNLSYTAYYDAWGYWK